MINFENLKKNTVKIDKFKYHWRFENSNSKILSEHLEQFQFLNEKYSKLVFRYPIDIEVFNGIPFNKEVYPVIDKKRIIEGDEKEIKKWLYKRGIPFESHVILSWEIDFAMILPWKLIIIDYNSNHARKYLGFTITEIIRENEFYSHIKKNEIFTNILLGKDIVKEVDRKVNTSDRLIMID